MSDTALRERLVKNGYESAKEWKWERSIDLLEKGIAGEKPTPYFSESESERYDFPAEIAKLKAVRRRKRG